jgi:hypothetical protein
MPDHSLLIAAAVTSVAVALLHVYVIAKGAPAYRFFGAGERLATMAERGSWVPALITWGITFTFMVFAAYYLSAAGLLHELPFLPLGLLVIAALYTLRGAALLPLLLIGRPLTPFERWSSLVSLAIGLLHWAAAWTYGIWPLTDVFTKTSYR